MPFVGRATDSSGVFLESPEDVSNLISMISPHETPYLDLVGDAPNAATRVAHEWLEESLNPNAISNVATIASGNQGDSVSFGVTGGLAQYVMEGSILEFINSSGNIEQMRVTAVSKPNTITVTRGFAGTTAAAIPNASWLTLISEAQLEGRDVNSDVSRPRPRKVNYTYIAMKDLILSGTEVAQLNIGGFAEYPHQIQMRTRECLRDLNKNAIRSRLSGNSIGGAGSVRTMMGLIQFMEVGGNVSTTTGSFSDTMVVNAHRDAWRQGGSDVDVLLCGAGIKEKVDLLNQNRVRTLNQESMYRNRISTFESTYGILEARLERWMPSYFGIGIATNRIKMVPLQGRSFHFEELAKTGDSVKGMIVGEYTQEIRNPEGMFMIKVPASAVAETP